MDQVFDFCVWLLVVTARWCGTSYKAINVWIFVILWPLVFVLLLAIVRHQRNVIRRLRSVQFEKRG